MDTPAVVNREPSLPWLLGLGFAAAPALTILGFIMAADLVLCLFGLVVDHRVITGAPAWLKPAKFAISVMIAAWSFAFCIGSTRIWRSFTRGLDLVLAIGFLLEIALIDMQAARGTTSHFNFATRFDAIVFAVMGVSIACIWLAMLALTVVLFRQPFIFSAWGWSLRLGMVLALVGTGSGALMTLPNSRPTGASERPAFRRGWAYGGCTGWRSRTAGHRLERRSRRSAGGPLCGHAWPAGFATAGLVAEPPQIVGWAKAAESHFCHRRQLPRAFRIAFMAGISRSIGCTT